MARTPKTTGPTQLTAAAATLFTCAAGTLALIREIIVANADGSNHTYTLSVGADAVGTRFQAATPITANQSEYLYPGITLTAGQVLQGFADAPSVVNVVINYDEFTLGY